MEVDESEADKMTILRGNLIDHLIKNDDIIFKSQQIGDPELTSDEKRIIVEECLKNKPLSFLARFSQYMEKSHFEYFKCFHPECEYEIGYYMQQNSYQKSKTLVKNRRLEALKRLALEGDYFTEEEMRKRNPLLYEHLVGKYLTEDERKEKSSFSLTMKKDDGYKLSSLLMEQYERDVASSLKKAQEDAEEEIESDTDESEDEDSEFKEKDDRILHLWGESDSPSNYIDVSKKISEGEKRLLFEEFRSHMYREFIGGKETDFDYSKVDMNTDYDDLDELDRDAEDKYFSTDSPEETDMDIPEDVPPNSAPPEKTQTQIIEDKPLDSVQSNSSSSSIIDDPLDMFMAHIHEEETNHQELNIKLKNTII